ncbi:dockerin type I domain-containing protein [Anabaenopsis elenkinii]|uniref:Dockerin domain-containing protein n=1 Tax=Anabaenopsis elenkinii CCIBt3563 TaxID=2779889 RepID=A0A7U3NKY1_9CYAN|nr:dockerin type I domain-containing protein [Anabaenopsis elenkinii]QOV21138.1 hypothetical protein IM676_10020 [Anabaenopsis elenkinii CCIBt3563]
MTSDNLAPGYSLESQSITVNTAVSGLAADIDGNGRVTGADLLFIDQYLLLRNNPNVDAILQSSLFVRCVEKFLSNE